MGAGASHDRLSRWIDKVCRRQSTKGQYLCESPLLHGRETRRRAAAIPAASGGRKKSSSTAATAQNRIECIAHLRLGLHEARRVVRTRCDCRSTMNPWQTERIAIKPFDVRSQGSDAYTGVALCRSLVLAGSPSALAIRVRTSFLSCFARCGSCSTEWSRCFSRSAM